MPKITMRTRVFEDVVLPDDYTGTLVTACTAETLLDGAPVGHIHWAVMMTESDDALVYTIRPVTLTEPNPTLNNRGHWTVYDTTLAAHVMHIDPVVVSLHRKDGHWLAKHFRLVQSDALKDLTRKYLFSQPLGADDADALLEVLRWIGQAQIAHLYHVADEYYARQDGRSDWAAAVSRMRSAIAQAHIGLPSVPGGD